MRVNLPMLILGLAILSGCGQMGPLYMPPEETSVASPPPEPAGPAETAEPQGET